MLVTAPALPKITDSFSSLIFFYDPLHKKILFSNVPMENFFGSSVNMDGDLPFTVTDQHEARTISNEWLTCLQLQEKQTHQFWFHHKLPDGSGIVFQFNAVGVRMEQAGYLDNGHGAAANSQCILFAVEKSPTGANAAWMMESERLRKMLYRYKEEYGEFIDIAAHNLDAPLRKLSVLMERLTHKYSKEEETQNYVLRIRACLDDMRSLIDSLAMLSRVSSASLKMETCILETMIDQEWHELKPLVKEKNATITVSSLPVMEGDSSQYRYLIKNLLENAIRFSKKDIAPAIHITAQSMATKEKNAYGLKADANYYKIEFRDNGIGFRQEFAEKIFRPFVRLHGKSEYPGNGIGLALCRSIADNHRGVIYAESSENEGSRFILLLPQTIN
jgi:signal transduction histidine kinase